LRDGSLSTLTLGPGTVASYNRAVSSLYADAAAANERKFIRAAVLARTDDLLETLQWLTTAVADVRRTSDFGRVLGDYPQILQDIQELRDTIRGKGDRQPLSCADLSDIRWMLGSMRFAMGSMRFTNGSFQVDRRELLDIISQTQEMMSRAVAVLNRLKVAVAADTTRAISAAQLANKERQVSSLVKRAVMELNAARSRLLDAEQRVRSYNERGQGILDESTAFVGSLRCE
jgi:hypothetical protein